MIMQTASHRNACHGVLRDYATAGAAPSAARLREAGTLKQQAHVMRFAMNVIQWHQILCMMC
jgi:hypothetical protein